MNYTTQLPVICSERSLHLCKEFLGYRRKLLVFVPDQIKLCFQLRSKRTENKVTFF